MGITAMKPKEKVIVNINTLDFVDGPFWCALGALSTILKSFGKSFTEEDYKYLYDLAEQKLGLAVEMYDDFIKPYGIRCVWKRNASKEEIIENLKKGYVLAVAYNNSCHLLPNGKLTWGGNHIALVVGANWKYIYVVDNMYMHGQIPYYFEWKEFLDRWYVYDSDDNSKNDNVLMTFYPEDPEIKLNPVEPIWKNISERKKTYAELWKEERTKVPPEPVEPAPEPSFTKKTLEELMKKWVDEKIKEYKQNHPVKKFYIPALNDHIFLSDIIIKANEIPPNFVKENNYVWDKIWGFALGYSFQRRIVAKLLRQKKRMVTFGALQITWAKL